jgi:hypothetical protein
VPHRLRIAGVVTFCDDKIIFVQDDSGSARVQLVRNASVHPGELIEATGFPEEFNGVPVLADARVGKLSAELSGIRSGNFELKPQQLDLNAPVRELPNQALVRVKAFLLAQKDL